MAVKTKTTTKTKAKTKTKVKAKELKDKRTKYPEDLKAKIKKEYKKGVMGYKKLAEKYDLKRDTVRYIVLSHTKAPHAGK